MQLGRLNQLHSLSKNEKSHLCNYFDLKRLHPEVDLESLSRRAIKVTTIRAPKRNMNCTKAWRILY